MLGRLSGPPPEVIGGLVGLLILGLTGWHWFQQRRSSRSEAAVASPSTQSVESPPGRIATHLAEEEDWDARARAARPQTEPEAGSVANGYFLYRPSQNPFAFDREPIGRDQELEAVLEALKGRGRVLLWGPNGLGKSLLASCAAQRLAREFAAMLWIDVGWASLWAICDTVARALGDEAIPTLPPERRLQALKGLLAGQDLLLILDDVPPGRAVSTLVQHCLGESVALLATATSKSTAFTLAQRMGPLERPYSIALLQARAAPQLVHSPLAEEICQALGDEPLALAIIADLLANGRLPGEEILRELGRRRGEAPGPQDISSSVQKALDLCLEHLADDEEIVLKSLAAFPTGGAGLRLISDQARLARARCKSILERLEGSCLLTQKGGCYLLHPLACRHLRERLGQDLTRLSRRAAREMLKYARLHAQDFPALEAQLGNLLGAMDHFYKNGNWQELLELMEVIGQPVSGFLGARGYWDQILKHARNALAAAHALGDERSAAHHSSGIAMIQLSRANFAEAKRLYQEALQIFRRLESHRNVAIVLQQLGTAAQETGDYQQAGRLLRESLALHRSLGDRQSIGGLLWALGNIALQSGEVEEALNCYNQSLEILRELGDRRGEAGVLHQLALIAQKQRDLTQARRLYEESLRLKRELGDQRGAALTLQNLATIVQALEGEERASPLLEEALSISRRFGDQVEAAIALERLGNIAQAQNAYPKARSLYQESLQLARAAGQEKLVSDLLEQLANIAYVEGRHAEAQPLYQQGLELQRKLGDSRGVATTLHQLANISYHQGAYETAQGLYRESLELGQELGEEELVARNLHQLGNIAHRAADHFQAKRLYEQSLVLKEKLNDNAGLASTFHQMGNVAYQQRYYGEARRLYQKSLALKRELGDMSGVASTLHQLGNVHFGQGLYAGARKLYEESLTLSRENGDQRGAALTLAQLALLEERLANLEKAYGLVKEATEAFEQLGLKESYEQSLENLKRIERHLSERP